MILSKLNNDEKIYLLSLMKEHSLDGRINLSDIEKVSNDWIIARISEAEKLVDYWSSYKNENSEKSLNALLYLRSTENLKMLSNILEKFQQL